MTTPVTILFPFGSPVADVEHKTIGEALRQYRDALAESLRSQSDEKNLGDDEKAQTALLRNATKVMTAVVNGPAEMSETILADGSPASKKIVAQVFFDAILWMIKKPHLGVAHRENLPIHHRDFIPTLDFIIKSGLEFDFFQFQLELLHICSGLGRIHIEHAFCGDEWQIMKALDKMFQDELEQNRE